jgi:hypothetical protein
MVLAHFELHRRTRHAWYRGTHWAMRIRKGFLLVAALVGLACGADLSCSAAGSGGNVVALPPPSMAAAPWVGCYACTTTIAASDVASVDAGVSAITLNDDGLAIAASGNTLTGSVVQLQGDAGYQECVLHATVMTNGEADLDTSNAGASCPVESLDPPGLFVMSYSNGTFALLDGGALRAVLVGTLLVYSTGDRLRDAGLGRQISQCTRLAVVPPCTWQ